VLDSLASWRRRTSSSLSPPGRGCRIRWSARILRGVFAAALRILLTLLGLLAIALGVVLLAESYAWWLSAVFFVAAALMVRTAILGFASFGLKAWPVVGVVLALLAVGLLVAGMLATD
jgi:hypothetical protein